MWSGLGLNSPLAFPPTDAPGVEAAKNPVLVNLGGTADLICVADANPIVADMFSWEYLVTTEHPNAPQHSTVQRSSAPPLSGCSLPVPLSSGAVYHRASPKCKDAPYLTGCNYPITPHACTHTLTRTHTSLILFHTQLKSRKIAFITAA